MKLDEFYSLRKQFVILGLTGRTGSGCSEIAKKLSKSDYISSIKYKKPKELLDPEKIKFDYCYKYLSTYSNFEKFEIIEYKNILLLSLVYESSTKREPVKYILKAITQYGDGYMKYKNRFGIESDDKFVKEIKVFLENKIEKVLKFINPTKEKIHITVWLKKIENDEFIIKYINYFRKFAKDFYKLMNVHSITKRTRFLHDIANNLRSVGVCYNKPIKKPDNLKYIYTVAEIINRLIKLYRNNNNKTAKIVIDALKNSLELMYFKEKYSGFYMVAVNKHEEERHEYIKNVIYERYGEKHENDKHISEIIKLDNAEYEGSDVNDGKFSAPDIENCIQKSDYHIFHTEKENVCSLNNIYSLDYQLVKLLALISHPGIVTPTAIERTMQIAFNAKYNSGCISRQVGAVITDEDFSIKSIGWNDVAQHQMSCKLRNVEDFVSKTPSNHYSNYELNGGEFKINDDEDFKTFKELVKEDVENANLKDLNGLNCSFCFKSFQNAYEGEKNQVHTRSLHAEENAMMQIAKYGGMGLKGGYLFSTASPCELCSKKAFQLGIKKIFYIDPYPGIARKHILKSGVNGKGNPELIMYQGAVGRAYHKLYEPFISYKDELKILTSFQPASVNGKTKKN